MTKVNLGSGTSVIEGWINIDKSWNIYLSKFPTVKKMLYKLGVISEGIFQADWKGKNVIRHDVKKGLPFGDESVNFIHWSHLLEHLTRDDARRTCQEACRVLKKDGIFRVVAPDLKLLAEKYVEDDRDFFGGSPKPTADLFLESLLFGGLRKRPLPERIFHSLHKYMYDAESLTFLLESAGFQDVRERNFREGACPDLREIENRTRSVYIEARK